MIVQSYQKKTGSSLMKLSWTKEVSLIIFISYQFFRYIFGMRHDDGNAAKVYREMPSVAHDYAFECSNQCQNIFKKEGRAVTVSNKLYVVKSCVPLKRIGTDQLDLIERDAQIEVTIIDDSYHKTWISYDSTIGEEQLLIFEEEWMWKLYQFLRTW